MSICCRPSCCCLFCSFGLTCWHVAFTQNENNFYGLVTKTYTSLTCCLLCSLGMVKIQCDCCSSDWQCLRTILGLSGQNRDLARRFVQCQLRVGIPCSFPEGVIKHLRHCPWHQSFLRKPASFLVAVCSVSQWTKGVRSMSTGATTRGHVKSSWSAIPVGEGEPWTLEAVRLQNLMQFEFTNPILGVLLERCEIWHPGKLRSIQRCGKCIASAAAASV